MFAAVTLCSVFLAVQAWWASEDDRIAGLTPIVIAVLTGCYCGQSRWNPALAWGVSGLVGFVAASAFALETVFHSLATDFLRRHPIDAQYSHGPELNALAVLIVTTIAFIAGGGAGFLTRYVTPSKKQHATAPLLRAENPSMIAGEGRGNRAP
ncbi:MAG: hypothetical protein ACYC1V_08055 [Pirellulaceae bacterium]